VATVACCYLSAGFVVYETKPHPLCTWWTWWGPCHFRWEISVTQLLYVLMLLTMQKSLVFCSTFVLYCEDVPFSAVSQ